MFHLRFPNVHPKLYDNTVFSGEKMYKKFKTKLIVFAFNILWEWLTSIQKVNNWSVDVPISKIVRRPHRRFNPFSMNLGNWTMSNTFKMTHHTHSHTCPKRLVEDEFIWDSVFFAQFHIFTVRFGLVNNRSTPKSAMEWNRSERTTHVISWCVSSE